MWKLSLVMTGIMGLLIGGVFYIGHLAYQEVTTLPQQDEPPAPFAAGHEEPAVAENQRKIEPEIILATAQETKPPVNPPETKEPETIPPPAYLDTKKNDVPQNPQAPDPEKLVPLPPPTGPGPSPWAIVPPMSCKPPVSSSPPVQEVVNCLWSIQMEVVKGRTILNAKAGKDASFRVECDRLELQAPRGCLKATGSVKISGPGLEGTSNGLTLNLQEDRLVLEGDVNVKSRREGQDLELTGDRLSLRLINNTDEARKVIPQIRGIPMLGPVPIALDFGFPIVKGPNDITQLFSFWIGQFR